MYEIEHYTDEEVLGDAERAEDETAPEHEDYEDDETDAVRHDAEVHVAAESGMQAVLEQKGGEPGDWELEARGDSGYRFDGEQVRGPDGSVWTNEDGALHQAMLEQWKDGGSAVFFLPDYRESTYDGEVLFVTQLILSEGGAVTYEIHKFETKFVSGDELGAQSDERAQHAGERGVEAGDGTPEAAEKKDDGAAEPLHIEAAEAVEDAVERGEKTGRDEELGELLADILGAGALERDETHGAGAVEMLGMHGISGAGDIAAGGSAFIHAQQTHVSGMRQSSIVRTRSRDGITLEMAA